MKPTRAGAFPAPPNEFPAHAKKFPAPAEKIPCPDREDICEVAFNALELRRELTPGSAGLAGNSKNSLPNSLPQGIHRPPTALSH